jgi:dsDNA-binding SOS-regulon protein
MIITSKQPRDDRTVSRLGNFVPYMLRRKGEERRTWYMAGNLDGLDRREDAELAVEVMEVLQKGNVRAKGSKTSEDRRLKSAELQDVVRRAVGAAGLGQPQYIAARHSEQEREHLHVAANKIHPETLKIHHLYKAIPAFQALASILEQELGLHRVDRSRGRSQSHRARDFEGHRSIGSRARSESARRGSSPSKVFRSPTRVNANEAHPRTLAHGGGVLSTLIAKLTCGPVAGPSGPPTTTAGFQSYGGGLCGVQARWWS